jgi:hypothetical protein
MSGAVKIVIDNLADLANEIPVVGSYIAPIMKAYGGIKGASLDKRSEINSQAMGLEGLEAQLLGATGSADAKKLGEDLTRKLTPLGFSSSEARQLGIGTAQSFQRKMTDAQLKSQISRLGTLQRLGINAQGVSGLAGSLQQATGKGVGASFSDALGAVDTAKSLDLRGAGVDKFLSSFQGMSEDFTRKGIAFSPKGMNSFIKGISKATGQKGFRPMQIAQGLMGTAGQARQGFMANFQQLSSLAVQAEAFRTSKGPLEALRKMEEIETDPDRVRQATLKAFGTGEGGQLALASIPGIGTRDAKKLAEKYGPIKGKSSRGSATAGRILGDLADRTAVEKVMDLSGVQAEQDRQTLTKARENPELAKKMIESQAKMDRALLKFTENETRLVTLYEAIIKALEKLERITP